MPLAVLIWALVGAVVWLFTAKRWWFPIAISEHARQYDTHFFWTLVLIGVIFVVAQVVLGWAVFRYRASGRRVRYSQGNDRMEILWTSAALVLFVGIVFAGMRVFSEARAAEPPRNAMRVEALGKQFAWSFRYAGRDGKFGRLDLRKVSDASGNPFGIDPADPAGADDVVTSALRVPARTPVTLLLRSRDVIHNFFVRELRLKQDLVPGMEIPFSFVAETPGTYEVACSELCGLGHHQMRTVVEVMERDKFEEWRRQMEQEIAQQAAAQ